MGDSYYLALYVVGITKESPIFNYLESGTHTQLAAFLGSTHECFLGDSFNDIINGA